MEYSVVKNCHSSASINRNVEPKNLGVLEKCAMLSTHFQHVGSLLEA